MTTDQESQCTDEEFKALLDALVATNDHGERDRLAIALAGSGRRECVPVLLRVIADPRTFNHRSTLVYACAEYDCAEWVLEFAELWSSSGPELDHHVLNVFDGMGTVHRAQLERAIAVLDNVHRDGDAQLGRRAEAARIIAHLRLLEVWG